MKSKSHLVLWMDSDAFNESFNNESINDKKIDKEYFFIAVTRNYISLHELKTSASLAEVKKVQKKTEK